MINTSEYCAVGHPDRTCDYIASYILDRYLSQDSEARVALEVQFKGRFCTVSGEVSSSADISDGDIELFCRKAMDAIGYTDKYKERFGEGAVVCSSEIEVVTHISRQSDDISIGVDSDGWGDQGIFWGYAENNPQYGFMPKDYWLARELANRLYDSCVGGIDIKTLVSLRDGIPSRAVIAIPTPPETGTFTMSEARSIALGMLGIQCEITVNGTGRYVTHGSVGDCGTTGRKLVVDFYGGNSRIGGGSPWGKDPTKADVSLNILARRKAVEYLKAHPFRSKVSCAMSCCIGKPTVGVVFLDGENRILEEAETIAAPKEVIAMLGLDKPIYAHRCARGLFGNGEE